MRMNKTKVLALALAVCMLAIASFSSLAWFTHQDSVTNDFLIAGSEDKDPDKVFSVDVWERSEMNGEKLDKIEFPAIEPGDDLYKEVNIENTGSYDQYIRVTVTLTDANIWQEIFGEEYVALEKIATDLNTNFTTWSIICDEIDNTLTYVLYYQNILPFEGEDIVNLFTNVAIPEALNRDQAAQMAGGFQLNVIADAVQTQNVGATAAEAFKTVGQYIEPGNFCIMMNKDIYIENNAKSVFTGPLLIKDLKITSNRCCAFQTSGNIDMMNVEIEGGSDADYAVILNNGADVSFTNVDITSLGGGFGVTSGAKLIYNGGKIAVNTSNTSARYNFYVVGEGTEVTIKDGDFSFSHTANKRAYVYAGAGATVRIEGGNFGKASTRSGYTAGILGEGTVIITGGTFGFDPSNWVAEGYEAIYDAEAKIWTVVEIA